MEESMKEIMRLSEEENMSHVARMYQIRKICRAALNIKDERSEIEVKSDKKPTRPHTVVT